MPYTFYEVPWLGFTTRMTASVTLDQFPPMVCHRQDHAAVVYGHPEPHQACRRYCVQKTGDSMFLLSIADLLGSCAEGRQIRKPTNHWACRVCWKPLIAKVNSSIHTQSISLRLYLAVTELSSCCGQEANGLHGKSGTRAHKVLCPCTSCPVRVSLRILAVGLVPSN